MEKGAGRRDEDQNGAKWAIQTGIFRFKYSIIKEFQKLKRGTKLIYKIFIKIHTYFSIEDI